MLGQCWAGLPQENWGRGCASGKHNPSHMCRMVYIDCISLPDWFTLLLIVPLWTSVEGHGSVPFFPLERDAFGREEGSSSIRHCDWPWSVSRAWNGERFLVPHCLLVIPVQWWIEPKLSIYQHFFVYSNYTVSKPLPSFVHIAPVCTWHEILRKKWGDTILWTCQCIYRCQVCELHKTGGLWLLCSLHIWWFQ